MPLFRNFKLAYKLCVLTAIKAYRRTRWELTPPQCFLMQTRIFFIKKSPMEREWQYIHTGADCFWACHSGKGFFRCSPDTLRPYEHSWGGQSGVVPKSYWKAFWSLVYDVCIKYTGFYSPYIENIFLYINYFLP